MVYNLNALAKSQEKGSLKKWEKKNTDFVIVWGNARIDRESFSWWRMETFTSEAYKNKNFSEDQHLIITKVKVKWNKVNNVKQVEM